VRFPAASGDPMLRHQSQKGRMTMSGLREMLLSGIALAIGATSAASPIGIYAILNHNAANPKNEPLKPKTSTLSRSDLIKFE
jgi:hypothetical protein